MIIDKHRSTFIFTLKQPVGWLNGYHPKKSLTSFFLIMCIGSKTRLLHCFHQFGWSKPRCRMEWCGKWTSEGANLASQSSMRAMMEPRPLVQRQVWTAGGPKKRVKKDIEELLMVIFDDCGWFQNFQVNIFLLMLVGRLMLEETGRELRFHM